jgi:hypothetical protein
MTGKTLPDITSPAIAVRRFTPAFQLTGSAADASGRGRLRPTPNPRDAAVTSPNSDDANHRRGRHRRRSRPWWREPTHRRRFSKRAWYASPDKFITANTRSCNPTSCALRALPAEYLAVVIVAFIWHRQAAATRRESGERSRTHSRSCDVEGGRWVRRFNPKPERGWSNHRPWD